MRKELIVNPCTVKAYIGRQEKAVQTFCKIELKDGNLSITGVVGPTRNGNCYGNCGQCVDEVRNGIPTDEWTPEMLQKFCDIWDEYHLNDSRPYCSHMKKLGWDKMAKEKVEVKTYTLTRESRNKQREAEKRALDCLKKHEAFFPTWEETRYYSMPYEQKSYNGNHFLNKECYEFKEKDCIGRSHTENINRGFIWYSESEEFGLLGKPCPVCGYKYGSQWLKEEIPEEVIEFLFNLPKTTKEPAWV